MIGSGSNRLITRNGKNGAFDLDFNLVLHKIPEEYQNNLQKLKAAIRSAVDDVIPEDYSHGKNSTSVITYIKRSKGVNFHFDIGLIKTEHNGQAYRLVYDNSDKANLIWNKSFKSNES